MTLSEYCTRLGWDGTKLARQASINERTARKAIRGEPVSPGIARKIAEALSREFERKILPGDIEGLEMAFD